MLGISLRLLNRSTSGRCRMSPSVFFQVLGNAKTLGAQVANVGLFVSVKAQMSLEIVLETEAFFTMRTVVRSLSSVKPFVSSQALPQSEPLFTASARVRLFPRVKALVPPQDLPAFELFAADLAGERVAAGEDALQSPNAVAALGEAAQSPSGVDVLMGAQIYVRRREITAGRVCRFYAS